MFKNVIRFQGTVLSHVIRYTWLFIVSYIFVYVICIPLFSLVGRLMLKMANVMYLSNTNLLAVITGKPLLDVGLILLLFAILIAIYWQITFLILGIVQINTGHPLTIDTLFKVSFQKVKTSVWQTIWFLFIYLILIIPFGGLGFSTPLLSKVKIPGFIVDFIFTQPLLLVILGVIYLVTFYLGIKLILVLPLVIVGERSITAAIKDSWRITKTKFRSIFGQMIILAALVFISVMVLYVSIYFIQSLFDTYTSSAVAFWVAVVQLLFIEIIMLLTNITLSATSIMIMLEPLQSDQTFINHTSDLLYQLLRDNQAKKRRLWQRLGVLLALIITVGFNALYLNGIFNSRPTTLSHRGVNDENGVQNTIPSLINTSRLHPDYIEMDIHETKDHQLVVMHDENLKNLTGVNKAPYQLTLKQLTKLTARENGQSAKVASFDDYFNEAHKLHQKLLIEIKTTSHDDPNLIKRFNQKYGARILKYKDRIHSLDYNAVQKLKTINPKLTVGYIIPFNFLGVPTSKADFFTMEYTTLNARFVIDAALEGKKVYAWTVNDTDAMSHMIFIDVDGIITDNVEDLQQTENDLNGHPSFAKKLINFTTQAE